MSSVFSKKGIIIIGLIAVFAFLYFFTGVFGETRINLTLRTNPDLENGLVAHYTFDSTDVNGSTVTDSAGSNDGTLYIDATTTSVIVDAGANSAAVQQGANPRVVWINAQDGLVLYRPVTGTKASIATTSDGGATWGNIQVVTDASASKGELWYDGWTEGDSGTTVHIISPQTDRLSYNTYDAITGTVGTPTTTVSTSTTLSLSNSASITKARDGTLYATLPSSPVSWVETCSSACDESASWTGIENPYAGQSVTGNDEPILIPIPGTDNVMLIWYQPSSSSDVESNVYSATSSSWWGWDLNIDQAAQEGYSTYRGFLSAVPNYANGNIYLATPDDINDDTTPDHDIKFWEWDGDTYTWTQKTNIITDASGITGFKISLDRNNGTIFAVYVRRTTMSDATTANVYYKYSEDNGTTWSAEQGPINSVEDELYGPVVNPMSYSRIGARWYGVTDSNIHHATVALLGESYQTKITPGNIGQAIEFDGVDDEVELGDKSALDLSTNTFSIGAWIKTDSSSREVIAHKVGAVNPEDGWSVDVLASGVVRVYCSQTGGDWRQRDSSSTVNDDEWHHVLVTSDSGALGTFNVYIDGVLDNGTQTNSGSGSDCSSSGTAGIGEYVGGNGGGWFDGLIDDVRVYNRALSAQEISRLYGLGATTHVNTTITTNPDLENDLEAHWTFDGPYVDTGAGSGSQIIDSSGNGRDAGWSGTAPLFIPGKIGQGMEVDPSSNNAPSEPEFAEAETSPLSVAIWFRADNSTGVARALMSKSRSGFYQWYLTWENNDQLDFGVETTSGNYDALSDNTFPEDGQWHHVVGVWDGSTLMLYVDGVQADATPPSTSGTMSNEDEQICIGALYTGATCTALEYNGLLDDARIYSRALTAEEVLRLYQLGATTHVNKTLATNPDLENGLVAYYTFDGKDIDWTNSSAEIRDDYGEGWHGDLSGGSCWTSGPEENVALGKIGQAYDFGGSSSNCAVIIDNSSGEFNNTQITIAAWIKPRSMGEFDFGQIFANINNGQTIGGSLGFCSGDSECSNFNNTFEWYQFFSGANGSWHAPENSIRLNQWQHVVVTYDRSSNTNDPILYVNGAPVTVTEVNTPTGSASYTNSNNAYIGTYSGAEYKYDGVIDDVRIYNRILSPEEVQRLYQLGQ